MRDVARHIRNAHWRTQERMAEHDPLWCCWWDKAGRYDTRRGYGQEPPADVELFGLIGAMEFGAWMRKHHDWFVCGEWSDERYAEPVRLTEAGRVALAHRELYDMEPVEGGMVAPGWQCVPLPKSEEVG